MLTSDQVVALLPAAGKSRRMGAALGNARSKVLLKIGAKTVVEYAIAAVLSDPRVVQVGLLIDHAARSDFEGLELPPLVTLIQGGENRSDSVAQGMAWVNSVSSPPAWVLVHDAARCCVSPVLIKRTIDAAFLSGAAIAAVPMVETVHEVGDGGGIVRCIPRQRLWRAQTPQVFRRELLTEVHSVRHFDATDDASLVVSIHPVQVVEGEETNIKVTGPQDIFVAQGFIRNNAANF